LLLFYHKDAEPIGSTTIFVLEAKRTRGSINSIIQQYISISFSDTQNIKAKSHLLEGKKPANCLEVPSTAMSATVDNSSLNLTAAESTSSSFSKHANNNKTQIELLMEENHALKNKYVIHKVYSYKKMKLSFIARLQEQASNG
jgi:hypothetical protein